LFNDFLFDFKELFDCDLFDEYSGDDYYFLVCGTGVGYWIVFIYF